MGGRVMRGLIHAGGGLLALLVFWSMGPNDNEFNGLVMKFLGPDGLSLMHLTTAAAVYFGFAIAPSARQVVGK
jgi:hypothetical protein